MRRTSGLALILTLGLLGASVPVSANVEEFQNFDVALQEEDDENLLDHFLTRMPASWRQEWDDSTGGFRSAQGCLTAGQWFMVNDLKVRTSLGKRAWMDITYRDVQDNEDQYGWLQLDFRYPTRIGAFGWRFRPAFDKSRQDFALLYDHGDGSTPLQVQAVFTVEDMFNSLWSFRQSRVGSRSEPYTKHPFEPALRVISRGAHHRVELYGQWLTSSRKELREPDGTLDFEQTLWGERAWLEARVDRAGWTAEVRFDQAQAYSTETPADRTSDSRSFRRRWVSEVALKRALSPTWTAEARWVYQERTQDWHPILGDGVLRAIDRMPVAEVTWQARPTILARFGTMANEVGIATAGLVPVYTSGSRRESRLFIGLQLRFGRVLVQGIEGIELDHESYEVSFHHDKGFLHLQTSF